jgi:hypothetical protein
VSFGLVRLVGGLEAWAAWQGPGGVGVGEASGTQGEVSGFARSWRAGEQPADVPGASGSVTAGDPIFGV